MRVLYQLGSLNRGGTETLILDFLRNLKDSSIVPYLVYRKSGNLENDISKLELLKKKISNNPLIYIVELILFVKQNKIELIHSQQPIDALYALVIRWVLRIKVVYTMHSFDYNFNKFESVLLHFVFKKSNLNVFVSEYQKEYFKSKYKLKPERIQRVYNGIDVRKFSNRLIKDNLRIDLGVKEDEMLLAMVGNFVPVRNQMPICRFFKLLNQVQNRCHLVFVGSKVDKYNYMYDDCVEYCSTNNLSNKVHFLGSRNDVPDILAQIDAFIYSTQHDTFGIAVVEAMIAGKPVFVNDWHIMKEITGNHAFIYATNNEKDLFEKFNVFLENKELTTDRVLKARNFAIDNFSIQAHINSLTEVYSKLNY